MEFQKSIKELIFGIIVLLYVITFVKSNDTAGSQTIVQTKLGKIRGLQEKTITSGKAYYAFRGIKYAKDPVGDLRFQEPVPITGWEGVLDATVDGPACPQIHIGTNKVIGKEACLVLNIYSADVDNLKPVIVYLHGGGFVTGTGSSELYGPDYLMDGSKNVVLVTVQYRLSVFGFLNTGDKEAGGGGNYGLLDQLEALRWVQGNVGAFGGDPEKVTLLGEGAGAASATLLTLTNHAKGLFRNVIALGGSPLNHQYWQKDPLDSARELASRIKCSFNNYKELMTCFKKETTENLVKEVNNMFSFFSFPRWFAPSIDNVLFKSSPEKLLTDGNFIKVPIMIGISRHEGAFYYPLTLNSFNDGKYDGNFIDQRIPRLLPVISEFESKLFPLTKILKKRYFTNIDFDNEDEFRPRYIDFLTDLLYTRFTSRYVNLLSNHSVPVYFFVLDYYGSNSIMNIIGDTDVKAIAHGDILQYIFTQVLGEETTLPEDDLKFSTQVLLPLMLNFATTSNPTPSGSSFEVNWSKLNVEEQNVLSVGKTLSILPQFRSNVLKFWEETVPSFYTTKANGKDEL